MATETADIVVMQDSAYQGFDGGTFGVPESEGEFWCRRITVRRESDGRIACSIGPREKALAGAIENLDRCETFVFHGSAFGPHDSSHSMYGDECPCECHKAATA